jgi:hypothetical protein
MPAAAVLFSLLLKTKERESISQSSSGNSNSKHIVCELYLNQRQDIILTNCHSLEVKMTDKRKYTTSSSSSSDDSDNECCSKQLIKRRRCNYCYRARPLIDGKLYCAVCEVDSEECLTCKRPLPKHKVHSGKCTACVNKQNRTSYQMFLYAEADKTDISVSSTVDPLSSLTDAREQIRDLLTQR